MSEILKDVKGSETIRNDPPKEKKKHNLRRYILYISFVLVATGLALFLSLRNNFGDVVKAFSTCNWVWLTAIISVIAVSILLDGVVIWVFVRLYTRNYKIRQGVAVSMVGSFYSGITPGASGGQVMQAYTMKKQGCQISAAASILVMYFILYQVALILFDLVTVIFKANLLNTIGTVRIIDWNVSLIPLTIMGFGLNVLIIGLLFLMSYSHKIHNFIMHYGVGLLGKLRILRNPDKTRESLRIQIENFKIELKRLQSNVPVAILIILLFVVILILKFSIPWFAGMALNGYGYHINGAGEIVHTTGNLGFASMFDACFMSAYHQMITGLLPLPGGAGISEIFFNKLFENYYLNSGVLSAAQIIWRSATFHIVLLASGLVSALYKASPKKEEAPVANRKTFVTMQYETYEERKKTSTMAYESQEFSKKDLQDSLKGIVFEKNDKKIEETPKYTLDDSILDDTSPFVVEEEFVPRKIFKKKKKKKNKEDKDNDWRDFGIH